MEEIADGNNKGGSFFACYLLTSLNPRFKGCHYIGFTVNPRRRIRQHNGELTSGAWRTHRKRPWDMVLCVYGFESQVEALQFEWAWQNPYKSLVVKEAAARIPSSVRGLKKQFHLLFTMLNCDKWSIMDLNVQFLSSKYIDNRKGCRALPPHMGLCISPVDTLPMNAEEADSELDVDVEKERSFQPNFSDTEYDDSGPPIDSQNHRLEELGRPVICDVSENRTQPPDVIAGPPASSSFASRTTQSMLIAVDLSPQAVDFRASDEYTLRKVQIDEKEIFPHWQEPVSPISVEAEASVSLGLDCVLETSPGILSRLKNRGNVDARGESKKSTSGVSEYGDMERRSIPNGDTCLDSIPEVVSFSAYENASSELSSMSPFSWILEQRPVKPPSSIVRRCLQQKSNASIPDRSIPFRNLSSDGFPENLPLTPPHRSRVVVVIPDYSPIASREVIDLTDSPF